MPILPWWIKPLAVVLVLIGVFYAGWHEKDLLGQAELETYKANVAQAQADFEKRSAQEVVAQTAVTTKAEQDHVQNITSLNTYWLGILRQRTASGSGKVSSIPAAPHSTNEIPTQCIPLAASIAPDVQTLVDLQNWIREQQAIINHDNEEAQKSCHL